MYIVREGRYITSSRGTQSILLQAVLVQEAQGQASAQLKGQARLWSPARSQRLQQVLRKRRIGPLLVCGYGHMA